MIHDPHIIEYAESEIYLLDIVYNDLKYQKYSYDDMCHIAQQFGFTPKEKAYEIGSWPNSMIGIVKSWTRITNIMDAK